MFSDYTLVTLLYIDDFTFQSYKKLLMFKNINKIYWLRGNKVQILVNWVRINYKESELCKPFEKLSGNTS